MNERALAGLHGREVRVDSCQACQSFWFDHHESLQLAPAAVLGLFQLIAGQRERPQLRDADVMRCPRCRARLRRTRDRQRATAFEYFKCPHEHGRFISFFEFLKKKDFVRSLAPAELEALRRHVQMVSCVHCGAAIDLMQSAACGHCGSPLSILDVEHWRALAEQLHPPDGAGASGLKRTRH